MTKMNFYTYFYCFICLLTLHLQEINSVGNKKLKVVSSGVENISPDSVGLVFFAKINNTSDDVDYEIEVSSDHCCLNIDYNEICDVMETIGDCVDVAKRGTTKTVKLVAPLLQAIDRTGYCSFQLDSKTNLRKRKPTRDLIKISFDTRIKNIKSGKQFGDNVTICNGFDEDPLNYCKPVDCETYYNGKRSYFDPRTKRCVKTRTCIDKLNDKNAPNTILDMRKNKCIVGKSISQEDINLIKRLNVDTKSRKQKDIILIQNAVTTTRVPYMKELNKNLSMLFESNIENSDKLFNATRNDIKIKYTHPKGSKYHFLQYFVPTKFTIIILAVVVSIQCCLICAIIYCLFNTCGHRKKSTPNLFAYRQEVSATTPLICASNIDTATTEFEYYSDTSNIDRKIKCYKACQKERKNNVKMSISDDILSKCLNRRDWNSKLIRSKPGTDSEHNTDKLYKISENENRFTNASPKTFYQSNVEETRKCNVKVNFKNELSSVSKNDNTQNNSVRRIDDSKTKVVSYEDSELKQSERELTCHNYNVTDTITASVKGSQVRSNNVENKSEKGAQIEFENDSIDDFLSQKEFLFPGEDLSIHSFSLPSNNSTSDNLTSAKTSKNKIVRSLISMLHKKSKGPASEPGAKKIESTNMNMEIIHMSPASNCSSSNNDTDFLRSIRTTKDSRTSL